MVSKKLVVPPAKLKIALLIPQLRHGGAERVVSRLSFILSETYTPIIVVFDSMQITYDVGCDIFSLNVPPEIKGSIIRKVYNVLKRIKRFRAFIKKNKIDISYSFGDTANIVNIFSKHRGKKIISIRGYKRIQKQKGLINRFLVYPLNKFTARKSDRIVSVSEMISNDLNINFQIDNDKIYTIYNGYDTKNIEDRSLESMEDYENIIYTDKKVIITAGTFREEKGYWHLIKAFFMLTQSMDDVILIILGTDYNNYKLKIINLVHEMGLDNKVFYLGYKENPYKYFKKSTLYVLSSVFEGFPNSLVEAMCCGLPVVSTNCASGPSEILMGSNGCTVNSENIILADYGILTEVPIVKPNYDFNTFDSTDLSLYKAIYTILSNPDLLKKYKEKALLRSKDFSYEKWSNDHDKVFDFER